MKKILGTSILSLAVTVFVILPYVLLSEYVKEIRELNIELVVMENKVKELEKDTRLLKQDVEIINSIILEKDFVKSLD